MPLTDPRGFSLVELLVAVTIIGILATIALPELLQSRKSAHDADAKSNARNMITLMDACWQDHGGYTGCGARIAGQQTGMPIGEGPGRMRVVSEADDGFVLVATSKANTGGVQHAFTVDHRSGGEYQKSCVPAGAGGCRDSRSW